jgi:hypothetical protein
MPVLCEPAAMTRRDQKRPVDKRKTQSIKNSPKNESSFTNIVVDIVVAKTYDFVVDGSTL